MMKISNFKFQISNFSEGFTLIELLIYMGILSILLTVLTTIFTQSLDAQLESGKNASVEQDGNYLLAKLSYDMNRASSITTPASLGVSGTSFQLVIGGVNYTYSIDGSNNLVLTNDSGINNLNSYDTSVSNFSVERVGNAGKIEESLIISFTLTSRTISKSGAKSENFQTTLSLRRQ